MAQSNTVTTFPRGFDGTDISMVASTTGNFSFQYPSSHSLGNVYNSGSFYTAQGGN